MRSEKFFQRALIWDQPRLSSSICLEVRVKQRQSKNPAKYGSWRKNNLLTCDHNNSAFIESIFKNYMRSGKDFQRASIWDQPQLPSLICSEVRLKQRQSSNLSQQIFWGSPLYDQNQEKMFKNIKWLHWCTINSTTKTSDIRWQGEHKYGSKSCVI